MKKTYLIFSVVLVALILAFSFTKTYLHSLEDETKWKQRAAVIQAELDSLEQEMQSQFGESKVFGSLPDDVQTSEVGQSGIDSVSPPSRTAAPEPETPAESESTKNVDLAAAAEDTAAAPIPEELTIYRLYVQRRLSLPAVITARNLAMAKDRIATELGETYGITAEQVFKIVDKVYEYRRKGSSK